MPKGFFRQIDIERVLRAAQKCGGVVEIDLRTMKVHIIPGAFHPASISMKEAQELITRSQMAPDGKENWDDEDDALKSPPLEVTTPAGLAERWMCSERHVRNLIARGELPAFKHGGKLLRIWWKDIEAFELSGGAPREVPNE
jgi:hypothetical protein